MIKTKTCFILGAGASQSYGFPLGGELVKNLVELTKQGTPNSRRDKFRDNMVELIRQRFFNEASETRVFQFSDLLKRSNLESIDRFLNFHVADPVVQIIGKAGIGFRLIGSDSILWELALY
jgi:hypothetical protein